MGNKRVTALCSHSFCAPCMINFIQSNGGNHVCCPYCRRRITYLVMQEKIQIDSASVKLILEYNRSFSDSRTLLD